MASSSHSLHWPQVWPMFFSILVGQSLVNSWSHKPASAAESRLDDDKGSEVLSGQERERERWSRLNAAVGSEWVWVQESREVAAARSLRSPTDPIELQWDYQSPVGVQWESNGTVHQPISCQMVSPIPVQSKPNSIGLYWDSPSGVQVESNQNQKLSSKLTSKNENCLHLWDLNHQPLIYSLYKHILRCSNHLS